MRPIELKIRTKAWFAFFIFFFAFSSGLLFYFFDIQNLTLVLTTTFFASVIVTGATAAIFSIYEKKVILTEDGINIYGFPSGSIAYNEIQRIVAKSGGFRIYGKGENPIYISSMSSNYSEAKQLLIRKMQNRKDIEFSGSNRLIHKYFIQ